MLSLRDFWRRGPVYRYFAAMEPIDRATALVVMVLALALGLSTSKIFAVVAMP